MSAASLEAPAVGEPGAGPPGGRSAALLPLALACALGAVLALLSVLGLLPQAFRLGAIPLLFGGLVVPVLVRWSPVRPSALKLGLCCWLLAPPLATALHLAFGVLLGGEGALVGLLLCGAGLQLLVGKKRLGLEPTGKAGALALATGALLALLVAAWLLRGSAPRVSYHGLLHAAVVQAVDRGVPPENPWLAGTTLSYYWFYHAMAAVWMDAFRLAPTQALALLNVWAAASLPLSLYAWAAPFWRDARRDLSALVLALLGLNALGGFLAWRGAFAFEPPGSALELFQSLQVLLPTGADGRPWSDPRLALALSKFGNLSSYPAALALGTGAWMAAAHALRHGARPWVGLTGACAGAALAVNPIVGGVVVATVLGASFFGGRAPRARTAAIVLAWTLPGIALVLQAGGEREGGLVSVGFDGARLGGVLWAVALLLPLAAAGLWRPASKGAANEPQEDVEGRRVIRALLAWAAFLPLALAPFVLLPEDNQYKLVRLAALPLGILAGGGLWRLLAAGGAARLAGGLLALGLAVGLGGANLLGVRAYLGLSKVSLPVAEDAGALLPVPPATGPGADRQAVYAWLRSASWEGSAAPFLVLNPFAAGPLYGRGGAAFSFADRFNLQGHEAAAFAPLALYADRSSYLVAHQPAWPARRQALLAFLEGGPWPALEAELASLGQPYLFLLDATLDAARPSLSSELEAAGLRLVFRSGGERLFASPGLEVSP